MRKATRFAALLLSMSLAFTAAGCSKDAASAESTVATSEAATQARSPRNSSRTA